MVATPEPEVPPASGVPSPAGFGGVIWPPTGAPIPVGFGAGWISPLVPIPPGFGAAVIPEVLTPIPPGFGAATGALTPIVAFGDGWMSPDATPAFGGPIGVDLCLFQRFFLTVGKFKNKCW